MSTVSCLNCNAPVQLPAPEEAGVCSACGSIRPVLVYEGPGAYDRWHRDAVRRAMKRSWPAPAEEPKTTPAAERLIFGARGSGERSGRK